MKRVLLLALLVVLALSVAVPAFAQDESLEIYITGLTEDTMNWFRETAFPAFQETHPGVSLEILTGGWGDFDATVAGWITTGDGPDIVYLGSEYAATYGDLLADVSSYLTEEDTAAFLPAAMDTVTWDGAPRGLPLLMSPRPIFYRTDLAAEGADFAAPLTFADALTFVTNNSAVGQRSRKSSSQVIVSISRWFVGSSSNSRFGCETSDRASSTRRFMPAERLAAPTSASRFICVSSRSTCCCDCHRCVSSRSSGGRPVSTTSLIVPGNSCGTSCGSIDTFTPGMIVQSP